MPTPDGHMTEIEAKAKLATLEDEYREDREELLAGIAKQRKAVLLVILEPYQEARKKLVRYLECIRS